MSDDTSIDLVVFQIIAEREHGSLVATHEPSTLESTQEVTLCTFDEISEIWFDDKDINQTLTLVQPRKVLIQRMLTQHHSCCQSFSVYLTLPGYLSEFEVPVRVHDLFGELHGYIQSVQTVQSIQNTDKNSQGVTLFCIRIAPVQIAVAELADDLENGNLHESQSVKFLREQLQAQEFHIQWIASGTSNEKCLCFELDKEYEDKIPLSIDTGTSLTRITHRGPCSQPIRVGVVNKPSESRHDHWNTVFKKMSTKGDYRKITLLSVNKVVDRFSDIMPSNRSPLMKILDEPLLSLATKKLPFSFRAKSKLQTLVRYLTLIAKF